jgi:YidC/Oxa1 family membrane protein insertase
LTILVRIIFWPLTHKSTKSMRKMQEIQPELKALQAKYKENPQKLQQETWAIYKKNKVNPLSSCLPMVIQIPVFIALFTVLRSAVELRYAPFLWIVDLSEPENLFAGSVPLVGALNILPVLMSGTMALQSYLTPSTGDPQQQKMMMIMMPAMMLFMFYSFPSALSLYWTVSQVLAIVQMLLLRRHHPVKKDDDGIEDAEVITTRQQRRQSARS